MTINPKVIDISHYDRIVGRGFVDVRASGIVSVIHKASEGTGVIDSPYAARRADAVAAGLLWGAYHFMRPGHVQQQVDLFLRVAQPDDDTLLALDYEIGAVTLSDARIFVEQVEAKTSRSVVVYSGNTIKEALGSRVDPFWGARRLWLAQYASAPQVQRSWQKPWLWQFTGDGSGPKPHQVPGIEIEGGLDISSWDGTDDELRAQWSGYVEKGDPVYPPPTEEPPVDPPAGGQDRKIAFHVAGKMSTFGGPHDTGVQPNEGLALYGNDAQKLADTLGGDWVLTADQAGAHGLARRINPDKFYLAARWPTDRYDFLRGALVWVENDAGKKRAAAAVDWGPNVNTGRVADLSPGLVKELGLDTNDRCTVTVYEDGK